jgi:pyruvate/2-oxoglutarate dehydrogenase complex dihydrolipoamide acyltransferase (E2) component
MPKEGPRVKVNDVIDFVVAEFNLDKDDFYKKLGSKGLLPKNREVKDVPTKLKTNIEGPKFASKQAELLASAHGITPAGVPSGKRGWTKTDIEKLISGYKPQLPIITKSAKDLAENHNIDWTKIIGTSKKGHITKSDILNIIKSKEEEEESKEESKEESDEESEEESEEESDDEDLPLPPMKNKKK